MNYIHYNWRNGTRLLHGLMRSITWMCILWGAFLLPHAVNWTKKSYTSFSVPSLYPVFKVPILLGYYRPVARKSFATGWGMYLFVEKILEWISQNAGELVFAYTMMILALFESLNFFKLKFRSWSRYVVTIFKVLLNISMPCNAL